MNFKILALVLISMFLASAASAYVYDAGMDISPNNIYAGQDFFIQGYVHSDGRVYSDDIRIDVYDYAGRLYTTIEPSYELTGYNGYYYEGAVYSTSAVIYTAGSYEVILKVDGNAEATDYIYDNDNIYNNYDYNYGHGNLAISNISLSTDVFYPGDIVDAQITVKNYGPNEDQYRLTYIVDNDVFKSGDVSYIQGNSADTITVPIEIPDADQFHLTVKASDLYNTVSNSEIFLISNKLKYFSISADKSQIFADAGNSSVLKLNIKNRGNENDMYTINIDGWNYYLMNDTVSIDSAKNKTVSIVLNVPAETRVGTYPIIMEVCNTENVCRTKSFELTVTKPESGQSAVAWNENLTSVMFNDTSKSIMYEFNVTNLGISEKDYTFSVGTDANMTANVSAGTFKLKPDESKTITLALKPLTQENHTATVRISASGSEIFAKDLSIEYSERLGGMGFTGMFISGTQGAYLPGLVILAFIGAVFLALTFYKQLRKRIWTEKVIAYRKRPEDLYNSYMNSHPRSDMANIYGPDTPQKRN
jgi:hypothetical protein